MIAPQQFLETFWQEKDIVYAETNVHLAPVYAKYFGGKLLEHVPGMLHRIGGAKTIDDVKQSTSGATVTTSEHFHGCVHRMRYHLSVAGDGWKIDRMEQPCSGCQGTGVSGATVCPACTGEGWYDLFQARV